MRSGFRSADRWCLIGRNGAYVRQEHGDDAQQWQPCADSENEFDAGPVGQPAEKCGPDSAQPEHEAEENAGDHAHFVRLEVGGIDYDGRKSRSDDQAGQNGHADGPEQIEVRQGQGERSRAEDGEQNDVFPSVTVAHETAEQGADGESGQIGKEAELRLLCGDAESLHEEEGELARHAGVEKILGENHQNEDGQCGVYGPR